MTSPDEAPEDRFVQLTRRFTELEELQQRTSARLDTLTVAGRGTQAFGGGVGRLTNRGLEFRLEAADIVDNPRRVLWLPEFNDPLTATPHAQVFVRQPTDGDNKIVGVFEVQNSGLTSSVAVQSDPTGDATLIELRTTNSDESYSFDTIVQVHATDTNSYVSLLGGFKFDPSSQTIASGVITAIQGVLLNIDTQDSDPSDELDTINAGLDGMVVMLRAANSARTVVVKHNTGNIFLDGAEDFSLDDNTDTLMLLFNGGSGLWCEISRSGPGVSGGMELVTKEADESVTSSATLQDDNFLLFPVAANEIWQFEGLLRHESIGIDLKLTFTGPSGAVGSFGMIEGDANQAAAAVLGSTVVLTINGNGETFSRFWGGIHNGSNAGNLQFEWAQNVSNGNPTIIRAGSYIKFQKQ